MANTGKKGHSGRQTNEVTNASGRSPQLGTGAEDGKRDGSAGGTPTSENGWPTKSVAAWVSAVVDGFVQIAAMLTKEPSRIYALFAFVLMVVVIAASAARQMTGLLAAILLTVIGLVTIMAVPLLRKANRLRASPPAGSRIRRFGYSAAPFALALGGLMGAAYVPLQKLGLTKRIVPQWYPVETAEASLREHIGALDRLLQAKTDDQRLDAFMDYAAGMTNDLQKRNLPKGAAELVGHWPKLNDAQRKEAYRLSNLYRGYYFLADRATVESISQETWRRIGVSGDGQAIFMTVVVSYSGRFFPNDITADKPRVAGLAAALRDPGSQDRRSVDNVLKRFFPNADPDKQWDAVGALPTEDLFEANAIDLMSFRSRATLGEPDSAQARFGHEVTFYSIKLERVRSQPQWKLAEIGKWGLHRLYTDPTPIPPPTTYSEVVVVDNVPYVAQADPSLCQSSALEMLHLKLVDGNIAPDQETIRSQLGKDPLSHDARLRWAKEHLPSRPWKLVYETAFPRAVDRIRGQLRKGVPVIMSTRLTPAGHVIVVTGIWRDARGDVIVRAHDPWGRFDFIRRQYDLAPGLGRDVEYPLRELYVMNREWRDAKGGRAVSKYIVGPEQWQPTHDEQVKSGLSAASAAAKDWEWLGVAD